MRVAAVLISGVSALTLRQAGEGGGLAYPAPALKEPVGVEEENDSTDSHLTVDCTDEVPHYVKVVFNTMMGCNRPKGGDAAPMCNNWKDGGCDNEVCHDFCHQLYTSEESYKSCKCKSWEAPTFKEHAPGAPCPLKIQPRCLGTDMYRSECEALFANPGKSAADLTVVPVADWPEGDTSAVKPGAC